MGNSKEIYGGGGAQGEHDLGWLESYELEGDDWFLYKIACPLQVGQPRWPREGWTMEDCMWNGERFGRKATLGRFYLSIDLRKAFDMVDWRDLDDLLKALGFFDVYQTILKQCYSIPSFSVLVEGEPTAKFWSQHWLWQDNPVSSFLFNIAMENLNQIIEIRIRAKKNSILLFLVGVRWISPSFLLTMSCCLGR